MKESFRVAVQVVVGVSLWLLYFLIEELLGWASVRKEWKIKKDVPFVPKRR